MYFTGLAAAVGGFVAGIVYGLRRSDAVLRAYEVMPGI
jgi:membrane associated rhomboid family serine protease